MKSTNPTTRARQQYFVEVGVSMALYVIVLFVSRSVFRSVTGPAEWIVALLPVIPVALVFTAIVRFMLGTDELERQIQIESLALAGGVTMLLLCTYGFIEGDPLPRLSAWWIYATFMASWVVASLFVRRRYR